LRPELKRTIPQRPSEYLRRLYFDTIVHSVSALDYLVKVVGPERVVVGTDYPMAMGDFDSVRKVKALKLSDADRELVLGGNATRALNL
jgi:aminocarboxymuconate-semialdehyde decarboxylase